MTAEEVLANLMNFELWDIQNYPMSKAEAYVCIKALKDMAEKDGHTEKGGGK